MNAAVSMLGMEEQRWGQHDARPALTSRSQRADAGPGPPRHSITLPNNAPSPAGQSIPFPLCALGDFACVFLRGDCRPPRPPVRKPCYEGGGKDARSRHDKGAWTRTAPLAPTGLAASTERLVRPAPVGPRLNPRATRTKPLRGSRRQPVGLRICSSEV